MKSVDKLVLLPFERYEQLIKNKEKTNEKKSSERDNLVISKSDTEKEKVSPKKTEKTPPKNTTEKENNTSEEKKLTPIIKVPPRPPGIPNKPKKHKLKWERLF